MAIPNRVGPLGQTQGDNVELHRSGLLQRGQPGWVTRSPGSLKPSCFSRGVWRGSARLAPRFWTLAVRSSGPHHTPTKPDPSLRRPVARGPTQRDPLAVPESLMDRSAVKRNRLSSWCDCSEGRATGLFGARAVAAPDSFGRAPCRPCRRCRGGGGSSMRAPGSVRDARLEVGAQSQVVFCLTRRDSGARGVRARGGLAACVALVPQF